MSFSIGNCFKSVRGPSGPSRPPANTIPPHNLFSRTNHNSLDPEGRQVLRVQTLMIGPREGSRNSSFTIYSRAVRPEPPSLLYCLGDYNLFLSMNNSKHFSVPRTFTGRVYSDHLLISPAIKINFHLKLHSYDFSFQSYPIVNIVRITHFPNFILLFLNYLCTI